MQIISCHLHWTLSLCTKYTSKTRKNRNVFVPQIISKVFSVIFQRMLFKEFAFLLSKHHGYWRFSETLKRINKNVPIIKRSGVYCGKVFRWNWLRHLPSLSNNPLHPNISMHILHTVLYTFPRHGADLKNLFNNQELL